MSFSFAFDIEFLKLTETYFVILPATVSEYIGNAVKNLSDSLQKTILV